MEVVVAVHVHDTQKRRQADVQQACKHLHRLRPRRKYDGQVYGAQPPNELLRQAIDSGGFYDTQKLFFKGIKDVVFLAACAPPGGGRNQVSPRLLRHFSMVWLTALSTGSLNRIFQAVLGGFLQATVPSLKHLTEPLVAASVRIYERIASELLPTPAKSHYTFNLRDLSKVCAGGVGWRAMENGW